MKPRESFDVLPSFDGPDDVDLSAEAPESPPDG